MRLGYIPFLIALALGLSGAEHGNPNSPGSIPTVSSVSPTDGANSGGYTVAVTGIGFNNVVGANHVQFITNPGNVATNAASYTVNSNTSMTVTVPAGAAGLNDLVVTNITGPSSKTTADHFTYSSPPTVTAISPSNGSPRGFTFVTITGTSFTGTLCSGVTIGSVPLASCTIVNDTTITGQTGANSAGTYTVTVNTPGGVGSLPSGYIYQGISPTWVAGSTDPNGNVMYGTETRQMVRHLVPNGGCLTRTNGTGGPCTANHNSVCSNPNGCWTVLTGQGTWEDSACLSGPQVDMLTSSLGVWYMDLNTAVPSNCTSSFPVMNSIFDGTFIYDYTGTAFATPVDIVIAGGVDTTQIYARNDTTGGWPNLNVSEGGCTVAAPCSPRAMAEYDDNSNGTHRSYLIVGGDGTTASAPVYRFGQPHNLTFKGWSAGGCTGAGCWVDGTDEAFVVNNGGTTCVTGKEGIDKCTNLQAQFPSGTVLPTNGINLRYMSIVKCPVSNAGVTPIVYNLFTSIGVQLWKRNDNDANSTWSLFSQVTNNADLAATDAPSTNGLRGIACVPTYDTIDHPSGYVLQGNLQIRSIVYQFDTQKGCLGFAAPDCTNASLTNLSNSLNAQWPNSGNTRISAYNGGDTFIYTDPNTGNAYSVFGMGNNIYNKTPRHSIVLSGTTNGAQSGIWLLPLSNPSTPTLLPKSPGTSASPTEWLNPALGGVPNNFPAAECVHQTPAGSACSGNISTRTMVCSPFPEDGANASNGYCGQVWFLGGIDAQGSPAVATNFAWLLRLPVDKAYLP